MNFELTNINNIQTRRYPYPLNRQNTSFNMPEDTFVKQNNIESDFLRQNEAEKVLNEMQNAEVISQSNSTVLRKSGNIIMKSAKSIPNDELCTKLNNNSILKEYAVLCEVERISPDITAPIKAIIQNDSDNHIVEKFVQGFHPDEKYMTEAHLQDLMSKLTTLDENGVFHRNLNSSNILCLKDGTSRVIGFSDFSLLSNFGEDIQAKYLNNDQMYSRGRFGIGKFITLENEQRYAGTFLKINSLDMACDLKNYADNPYLNVKSNISNFEYNHMFPSLKNNISENSFEYLKNYVRIKGQIYHAKMAEFLKKVEIKDFCFAQDEKTKQNVQNSRENLKKAIEYEELAQEVLSNPSEKILKTETAKIQLKHFLFDSQNSSVSKLKDAYNKTVELYTDSIALTQGKEQKYLKETLSGIQERFKNITFLKEEETVSDTENLVNKLFGKVENKSENIIETIQNDMQQTTFKAKSKNKVLLIIGAVITGFTGLYFAIKNKLKSDDKQKG